MPLVVILQHIISIILLIMFFNKDSLPVFNIDYQMVKNKLAFMITKTLFIRCYSSKCGLSYDS